MFRCIRRNDGETVEKPTHNETVSLGFGCAFDSVQWSAVVRPQKGQEDQLRILWL